MEILSYGSAPCFQVVDSKRKGLNSHQSRFPTIGNHGLYCTNTISGCRPVIFFFLDQSSNLLHQQRDHRSLNALEGFKRISCKVYSGSSDGYVIGSEEGITDISEIEKPAINVLIPGVPDRSNGEFGAPISSFFWEWKPKLNVHYQKAGCENVDSQHVLFLPGFGVGFFHYEKQLKELGHYTRVWALDFLGQGMCLPFEDPVPHYKEGDTSNGNVSSWGFGDEAESWATKLVYSIDLWQDQVRYFVEEAIDMCCLIEAS